MFSSDCTCSAQTVHVQPSLYKFSSACTNSDQPVQVRLSLYKFSSAALLCTSSVSGLTLYKFSLPLCKSTSACTNVPLVQVQPSCLTVQVQLSLYKFSLPLVGYPPATAHHSLPPPHFLSWNVRGKYADKECTLRAKRWELTHCRPQASPKADFGGTLRTGR